MARRWLAMARMRLGLLGRGDWAGIAFTVLLVVVALGLAWTRGASSCAVDQLRALAAMARSDREIREAEAGARCTAYATRRDILREISRSACLATGSRHGDATTNTQVELAVIYVPCKPVRFALEQGARRQGYVRSEPPALSQRRSSICFP